MRWSFLYTCLLAYLHTSHAYECPDQCTCTQNTGEGRDTQSAGKPVLISLDVDCSIKDLTEIPNLDGLKGIHIHHLNLDYNEIENIQPHAFSGLEIHEISFNSNPIQNVSDLAFGDLENNLEYLSMQQTKLESSPKNFLKGLTSLRTLDFSKTSSDIFYDLTDEFFGSLPSLEVLIIKSSRISSIHTKAFVGVESIGELKLDGNKIQKVPEAIQILSNLQYLSLYMNKITSISQGVLSRLPKLKVLNLSDNIINNASLIHKDAFGGSAPQLEELYMKYNDLTEVPTQIFGGMVKLKMLSLAGCGIQSVPTGAFADLESLEDLDLSSNPLEIEPSIFNDIEDTLISLKINSLNLDKVPTEALKVLKNLQSLDMNGNQFSELSIDAFQGVAFRKLQMMYCGIESIDSDTFEPVKAPIHVVLNHNDIKNLTFVTDPCKFDSVEVFGNSIDCNCDIHAISKHSTTKIIGKCTSPPEYAKMDLGSDTLIKQLGDQCQTNTTTIQEENPIQCDWWESKGSASGKGNSVMSACFSLILLLPFVSVVSLFLQ